MENKTTKTKQKYNKGQTHKNIVGRRVSGAAGRQYRERLVSQYNLLVIRRIRSEDLMDLMAAVVGNTVIA